MSNSEKNSDDGDIDPELREFQSQILESADEGTEGTREDSLTTRQWMERTYRRLHRIATSQMNFERGDHTLSATGLVHEVFVRLQNRGREDWISERQFLGIVASEMKRVLVDAARRKQTVKRGGDRNKVSLPNSIATEDVAESISELNEAIEQFELIAPKKAELVRLRYFLGLSETEAAEMLGISRATASRHWAFARAWLLDYMTPK